MSTVTTVPHLPDAAKDHSGNYWSCVVLAQSHVDHGISESIMYHCLSTFNAYVALAQDPPNKLQGGPVYKLTTRLPDHLGFVPSGLYGPKVFDPPVEEEQVFYQFRGNRQTMSRMVDLPHRPTRDVTIIAGPFGDEPLALYTIHGGPLAPKEPATLTEHDSDADRQESIEFWAVHALSSHPPNVYVNEQGQVVAPTPVLVEE